MKTPSLSTLKLPGDVQEALQQALAQSLAQPGQAVAIPAQVLAGIRQSMAPFDALLHQKLHQKLIELRRRERGARWG